MSEEWEGTEVFEAQPVHRNFHDFKERYLGLIESHGREYAEADARRQLRVRQLELVEHIRDRLAKTEGRLAAARTSGDAATVAHFERQLVRLREELDRKVSGLDGVPPSRAEPAPTPVAPRRRSLFDQDLGLGPTQ